MLVDALIVLVYFCAVMFMALRGSKTTEDTKEAYFLSDRNLPWYSVAISTIATNVQGYQFLGMMGSAYLYGIAQASLEINAIQGILMAAFIFVPMYLSQRVITITQWIKSQLGEWVGTAYSVANIALFSTIGLGAALFWGAYAAELIFGDLLSWISQHRLVRVCVLIVFLGVFSAIYTYLGGLAAVVKTDLIQFSILILGGTIILFASLQELGGWSQLYEKTPEMMHLHLDADHPKLPWTHIFGLFLLNINYWCANQSVIQRSLAARNLKHAQVGLMAGGVMKYFMALLIVVPGIALVGILGPDALKDPDETFPYLVSNFLGPGLRGVIICALFASLMSTVDSLFNSLATLWSIDIYKEYINKEASDAELISAGRMTIEFTLITGVLMACFLASSKLSNAGEAFTHQLNEMRYYVNCGIVILICSAAFMFVKRKWIVLLAFLMSVPVNLALKFGMPDMNYFVRAMWVILSGLVLILILNLLLGGDFRQNVLKSADRSVAWKGLLLGVSLMVLHILFH